GGAAMRYRFVETVPETKTPDAGAPVRSVLGWVVLAVVGLVLVASVANWAAQPGTPETPQGFAPLPGLYRCEGAEVYPVQLSPADMAAIEAAVSGPVRLPMRVSGCVGLTAEEIARREARRD
ncbi:MAG: hypothetical protein DCC55_27935, partial [Chloroflexi bacterium]